MRGATLRQLKAFALVARYGSFVQAAVESHLTASAVSLQIKELEQTVGLPLLSRQGRGVALTAAGEILLEDVQRALANLSHADDALARLRAQGSGSVTIGMVDNAKYFLPHLLARFHRERPGVQLHLSVANRAHLIERLRRGAVDLAVMGEPPKELVARAEAFADQELGIVGAPEHALACVRGIAPSKLAGQEFIVREPGSGTRAAMERFFLEHRIDAAHSIEMSSDGAIRQAVMANMGLGFISLPPARLELNEGLLVAIDVVGLPVMRRWYIVDREGAANDCAVDQLRNFILDSGRGPSAAAR